MCDRVYDQWKVCLNIFNFDYPISVLFQKQGYTE